MFNQLQRRDKCSYSLRKLAITTRLSLLIVTCLPNISKNKIFYTPKNYTCHVFEPNRLNKGVQPFGIPGTHNARKSCLWSIFHMAHKSKKQ